MTVRTKSPAPSSRSPLTALPVEPLLAFRVVSAVRWMALSVAPRMKPPAVELIVPARLMTAGADAVTLPRKSSYRRKHH